MEDELDADAHRPDNAGLGNLRYRRLEGVHPAVIAAGDVDLANIGHFVSLIEETAATAQGLVVLVLDRVTYFDSQGVRALLRVQQRLALSRGKLAIVVRPSSPLRPFFDVSGLQAAFPVFDTVDEAIAESPS